MCRVCFTFAAFRPSHRPASSAPPQVTAFYTPHAPLARAQFQVRLQELQAELAGTGEQPWLSSWRHACGLRCRQSCSCGLFAAALGACRVLLAGPMPNRLVLGVV